MPSRERDQHVWWQGALVGFRGQAAAQLRQRFPSIAAFHEDLVSEAVTDITAVMQRGPGPLTLASWFADAAPPQDDTARFERLAFAILNRRVADHFRAGYKRWVESLEDHPEASETHSDDPALDLQFDMRRATHALLKLMAQLPARDRAQLEAVALGGGDAPMSEKDRQRLRRLRASLQERLRQQLGEDALALIRRL